MNKKKQINENILVFVRCRPLTESELHLPVTVEVHPEVNKIFVRDTGTDKSTVKSFSFDKVFSPAATQGDIYAEVVAPMVQEVIQGFNCTIFAYGQTGTGKTFTIEGERSANLDDRSEDPLAGLIPRSMSHLFRDLTRDNMQFDICVSFLELYNEEIFDLLSKIEEPVKLRMFDNSSQKGSVIVQGLQILPVKTMDEVYAILDKGCKKRRKAATLLNKASSRSHTIFTVTVSVKESFSTLEKVKMGKLNLVDLAGSENIGRSGAIKKRAREAGNINQSLLALGRVITSLCEKAVHIPYRESKLTRLLQDSLGGQTKTAVIATVSPSSVHIDETINTLEYALRAKNITNKPELNSQFTLKSLMKDYLEKIKGLRKELNTLGNTNGYFVPEEIMRRWESTLESKRKEKFRILSEIERVKEEDKLLDTAIAEANDMLNEKQSRLKKAKEQHEEYQKQLEKEKKEHKMYEKMVQIMQPMSDSLHETLHKELAEIQTLESETTKMKEILKHTVTEERNLREKMDRIREARKLCNDKFRNTSDNIMNNIRNMKDNVNLITSECSNYLSLLKTGFEERATGFGKKFESLFKAVSDLEAINNSFQESVEASLHEEKSTKLKEIDEFYDTYLAYNETSVLEPLNSALNEFGSSLLCISSALNDWKKDLTLKMNARQKVMKECIDNQNSSLESTVDSVKMLLDNQKENLDACNSIVSESLSSEANSKKVWNEKFRAVEHALSSLDIFCSESIDNEIEKSNQTDFSMKNISKLGCEITEKITAYCENSVKSIDDMQEEVDNHAQNIFSENWEDLKTKVSSCSWIKDLNTELAKLLNTSQNVTGRCSEIEDVLKNKFTTSDQSKLLTCVQMMIDSLSKSDDTYKSSIAENQIEDEALLSKDHLERLRESSEQLSNTLDLKVSGYLQCLETDLLKNLKKGEDTELTNTRTERSILENTVLDMDETITSLESSENIAHGCPRCNKSITDETLQPDSNSTSLPSSKDSMKCTLKPLQATCEASGSKSFTSAPPQSPVRRPTHYTKSKLPRRLLQFLDLEKLTEELLEHSSDDEESATVRLQNEGEY